MPRGENLTMDGDTEIAERLLAKVRAFVAGLDDDERQLFAALIGPGVALAHGAAGAADQPGGGDSRDGAADADEVVGFDAGWSRRRLPEHLADVMRRQGVRVVGL